MTLPPPTGRPSPGYSQLRIPQPPGQRAAQTPIVPPLSQTTAPTLFQFWRSDVRTAPGRRRPRWAGHVAFWVGLLALALYLVGVFAAGALLVAIAAPFAAVALLFALIALIAGIGRALGFFGLLFALAGSWFFWSWIASLLA